MVIELSDDVYWISECYDLGHAHEHVSVYLIRDGENHIVVDTGSFYHRDSITSSLENATNTSGVDAIVLSHSDYPHSGNVRHFESEWDDVEIVASSASPEIQGLPQTAKKCTIGSTMDVLGRQFSFIDPPLADRSHTTWIYDHGSGVLFTADGFGSHHEEGACDATSDVLSGGIAYDDVYAYHKETLVWLRYVEPEKLRIALESILDEYEISWIAPIHGHPIAATDVDGFVDDLVRAAAEIEDDYSISDTDDEPAHL